MTKEPPKETDTTSKTQTQPKEAYIPVDFIYSALQWGLTELRSDGFYHVKRPAPVRYGLRIYDEEHVDRSRWGPVDIDSDEEDSRRTQIHIHQSTIPRSYRRCQRRYHCHRGTT